MLHRRPLPRRHAFTLIELLVVVAIIGVLIAILLPALGKARDQAKTAACLANLHGIGIASAAYVANNNGYLFPCEVNWFDNGGHPVLALEDILVQYVATNMDVTTTRGKAYFCPSAIDPHLGNQSQFPITYDANMGVHVRMTPALVGSPTVATMPPLNRITQVTRPGEVIALGDGAQATKPVDTAGPGHFDNTGMQWGTSWVAAPSRGDLPAGAGINDPTQANQVAFGAAPNNTDDQNAGYHPRYRHNSNQVANFLMADGHAEALKYKTTLNRNFSTGY